MTATRMPSLAVKRHPSIRDQIADTLRAAITNSDLVPGQLLVERELCELTGASRPSVREALRQLEAEGLVESRNGRGTVIRVLTKEEIANLYEVRAELEGFAARLFCARASDTQRQALQRAIDRLAKATRARGERSSEILAAQREFYSVLFSGAGNALLDQMVNGLQARLAQLRATTLGVDGRAEASLAEFELIAEAIRSGNGDAAQQAAVDHVHSAAVAMEQVAQPAQG